MKLLSIVVPLYNESGSLFRLRSSLDEFGRKLPTPWQAEFILVDDGSGDDTWTQITAFAHDDSRVKGIRLSRNFGHQAALFCGYEFARGDAVVSMDGDLQDPPEVALQMLDRHEHGADVVFAVRSKRTGESAMKLATAHVFYRLLRWLGETEAPLDSGDFRLLSRRALNALLSLKEKHKYLRGMVGWIGYQTDTVEYSRPPRQQGTTKFTWSKMARFATEGIVSFSKFPLRLSFFLCIATMLPFLGYLTYALLAAAISGVGIVPGWSSLLLCVVVFGSVNLVSLGILGEYVGRVFESTKQRPDYFVMEVTSPDVIMPR